MIENRELGMDDYLAMLRRRSKVLLLPALLAPIAGFLVSYAFPPRYTSQATILVEEQTLPEGYVKPVVTEDLIQRMATMQQQVLSRSRLKPMVERLSLAKKGQTTDDVVGKIQQNVDIEPLPPNGSSTSSSSSSVSPAKKKPGQQGSSNSTDIPGFYVNYTADNAGDAQKTCNEITSMLLEENLKARQLVAQTTHDFLDRQVEEAKRGLDDQDSKLAAFKQKYLGQLPGDEDTNLKILMGLNSQLDANTQNLNRAQQDKTYAESVLSQDIAAWKTSQSATNPQVLQDQLSKMQAELVSLQSRYTDDHPDVVKAKADIASLQKKIAEINAAPQSAAGATPEKVNPAEPPEIRQLRVQIHQYGDAIAQAGREQKRLQDSIAVYQGRVALSPAVEEQFKSLTRDYETAQKSYADLLAKRDESAIQTDMERHQEGEQMRLLNPAGLPDSPSFPMRWMFAAGGLGAGAVLGFALVVLLELQDKSIRNEKDILAALELPMLVSLPWVGPDASANGGFLGRFRETVERVEV